MFYIALYGLYVVFLYLLFSWVSRASTPTPTIRETHIPTHRQTEFSEFKLNTFTRTYTIYIYTQNSGWKGGRTRKRTEETPTRSLCDNTQNCLGLFNRINKRSRGLKRHRVRSFRVCVFVCVVWRFVWRQREREMPAPHTTTVQFN